METLFEPIQESLEVSDRPQLEDLRVYDVYAINVNTVLRNILSNFKLVEITGIRFKYFAHVLLEEITFIEEFFQNEDIKVEFYINTHKFFVETYKDKLRKSSTDKQILMDMITDHCLKQLPKDKPGIKIFNKDVTYAKDKKVLIMTHVPADLLSVSKHLKLDLLESHTGLIKTKRHFNSKYFKIPKMDMSFLPFQEYLLTVFGDSVMFKPAPMKERLELYEALLKRGVNPLTTETTVGIISK